MRSQALSVMLPALAGLGDLPDACYENPASDICKAARKRFHYDRDSGRCNAFIRGGCGGNVPFDTLEQCRQTCNPGDARRPAPAANNPAPTESTEE